MMEPKINRIESAEDVEALAQKRPIAVAGMSLVQAFHLQALVMAYDEGNEQIKIAMLVSERYPHAESLADALEDAAKHLRARLADALKDVQEHLKAKAH